MCFLASSVALEIARGTSADLPMPALMVATAWCILLAVTKRRRIRSR